MKKNLLLLLMIVSFFLLNKIAWSQPALGLETIASGFVKPIDIVNAGDSRLFIVEQDGRIKILHNDGSITTFLDIDAQVKSTGNEQGLLGLAFHPNYTTNGYFYVNYINNSGNTRISRFSVSATNPDLADPASELILLTIQQPYENHNGGNLIFGPDGYLYIGMGDGGSGGDPGNRAQDINVLLGKMLRIDVNSGSPYGIPPTNPFVGVDGADEVWAYGLRNPWRWSFDRQTGDLWIADVGQDAWEEVDFQAANSIGGQNYGWRCYEGNHTYNTSLCNLSDPFVFPIDEYPHNDATGGDVVIGGFVYRGTQYPVMNGYYMMCDDESGHFWTIHPDGIGGWIVQQQALVQSSVTSFGEGVDGEIYAANLSSGEIYHVKATATATCGAATMPQVTNITSTSATVSWVASGASSYKVIYKKQGSTKITVSTSGTSVALTGLVPSSKYTYKIQNKCPGVTGAFSVAGSFKTLPARLELQQPAEEPLIYPNPGSGSFTISNAANVQWIRVIDVTGKELMQLQPLNEETIHLDLSAFSDGVYFIVMKDPDQMVTKKLIIER